MLNNEQVLLSDVTYYLVSIVFSLCVYFRISTEIAVVLFKGCTTVFPETFEYDVKILKALTQIKHFEMFALYVFVPSLCFYVLFSFGLMHLFFFLFFFIYLYSLCPSHCNVNVL